MWGKIEIFLRHTMRCPNCQIQIVEGSNSAHKKNLDINMILFQLVKSTMEVPCLLFNKQNIVLIIVKLPGFRPWNQKNPKI